MVNGLQALNLADRLVFAAEDPTGVNPWALAHASRQVAAPVIKPVPAEVVTYLQRPFALALFLESGGPATWTAHGLPPGIESNPVTGELTGRATYPGAYAVTLDAANSGATGVARFTLRVLAPPELDFSFDESGISLVARGEPGQRYAIQFSSDFISWETFLPEVQAGDNTRVSFAQMNARGIGCFRLVVK